MRRLFIQIATVLALVIAPIVAFASPLVSPAWLSEKLDDDKVNTFDKVNNLITFCLDHTPNDTHTNDASAWQARQGTKKTSSLVELNFVRDARMPSRCLWAHLHLGHRGWSASC